MNKDGSKLSVSELLSPYTPEVRALALATRALIREVMPGAKEELGTKPATMGYGAGASYADMIFSIMPAKALITLGIARGTELSDPEKLMEGAGKVHRHVKIKGEQDLKKPALKALLEAAVARWKKKKEAAAG